MKRYNIEFFIHFIIILSAISCDTKKQSRVETLPYYNDASFTPIWAQPYSRETDKLHKIPSFTLTNQDGEKITEDTFANKIYVADFFFTSCPGICPLMTDNMRVLQETFRDDHDVLLLSHSVTPTTDSVPVLKDYAVSHRVISGKWHLATGKQSHIYYLGRNGYWVEEDLGVEKSDDEFLHTENFILVDKKRQIRGIYNGLNRTSIDQLIADIRTLKNEK